MARKLFLVSFSLLALIVSYCALVWVSSDSIGKAGLQSEFVLSLSDIWGYEKSAKWLELDRAEAPSHQTMINVVDWCIKNPKKANVLLVEFEPSTIGRLNWAAKDSGQEKGWLNLIQSLDLK